MPKSKMTYRPEFYATMAQAATHAARRVVPIILSVTRPRSVIDVGCGPGAWARAMHEAGVSEVVGIDGDWLQTESLLIPPESFVRADLGRPFSLERRFDVCLSLETAEHLPEGRARGFVHDLTRLSDVIVFSAAVPYQGGTNHVNERWQDYWVGLFEEFGYLGIDYIRRRIWMLKEHNTWFYAQNMIIFVKDDRLSDYPALNDEFQYQAGRPTSLVHPGLLLLHLPWEKHLSVRSYFRLFPAMIGRAVAASLRGLARRPAAPPRVVPPPGAADWIRSEE